MSAPSQSLPAYALIIAVSGHKLVAPESDAVRLQRTLVSLGVRPNSIELLTGANATRNNIIRKLRSLCEHPRIARDAPILIYFAGHGMQQKIRIPGLGERKAEFIMPFDALTRQAHPIPDITISALLGTIARYKGNHITLLFDCCHSGGSSRDVTDDSPRLPEDLLNVDKDGLEKEDGEIWSEFLNVAEPATTGDNARAATTDRCSPRYQGVTSHVLIASCRENEQSFEYSPRPGEPPHGLFTAALIEALDESRRDKMIWNLTYSGLFTRIKDIMQDIGQNRYPQTPQCEGYHRDRGVFATPAFPHRQHAITPVDEYQQGRQPGLYVLPVGSLAGVPQQATFEIYDYPGGRRRLVGRFPLASGDGNSSVINAGRDLQLGPDAYAVLCTPPAALAVEMAPDFAPTWNDPRFQADLIARLGQHYPLHYFITPVQPGTRSKLKISGSLRHGVRLQTDAGSLINIPHPSIPMVAEALTKAVMFYYYLGRPMSSPRGSEPFDAQILELEETSVRDLPPDDQQHSVRTLVPHPSRRAIVLQPDTETRIPATHPPETNFGLRFVNKKRDHYFVYVFYFDPNDFSILPIYMPPSVDVREAVPPLRGASELTIGYGNEGASPLQFTIDSHLERDLGFFKVYYSRSPSEMSTIQQDGFDPNQHGTARPGGSAYKPSSADYGSVLYPVAVVNPQRSRR